VRSGTGTIGEGRGGSRHTQGDRWPTHETSGQAGLGRKEGGHGCTHHRGKEKTHRGFLWVVVNGLGLSTVAGKGR